MLNLALLITTNRGATQYYFRIPCFSVDPALPVDQSTQKGQESPGGGRGRRY